MYKLSRYWNKFAYLFLDLTKFLVWDYTGQVLNSDTNKTGYEVEEETAREILTSTRWS